MTLNSIVRRIQTIALAHNQVRSWKYGLATDFFTDHTTKYPAVCLQDNGGVISTSRHQATINFRMFILDLPHVAHETKDNELDVLSDTLSIALDLIAQINNGNYTDWKLDGDDSVQFVVENEGDMNAGVVVDLAISFVYTQNVCAVPSDLEIITPEEMADKLVYDEVYIATGDEGTTLTIPVLAGKKLLYVGRGNSPIYRVSNLPDSEQYTWDDTDMVLGAPTNFEERFLILYRNY